MQKAQKGTKNEYNLAVAIGLTTADKENSVEFEAKFEMLNSDAGLTDSRTPGA